MGITIHYRGRLADLTRIDEFEDWGGSLAQISRS
jgi:hypothetical protein